MTDAEREILITAAEAMADFVPCTECRYCCDNCPMELDIPALVLAYSWATFEVNQHVTDVMRVSPDDKKPHACTKCGACVPLCPQKIDIPNLMGKLCDLLERRNLTPDKSHS